MPTKSFSHCSCPPTRNFDSCVFSLVYSNNQTLTANKQFSSRNHLVLCLLESTHFISFTHHKWYNDYLWANLDSECLSWISLKMWAFSTFSIVKPKKSSEILCNKYVAHMKDESSASAAIRLVSLEAFIVWMSLKLKNNSSSKDHTWSAVLVALLAVIKWSSEGREGPMSWRTRGWISRYPEGEHNRPKKIEVCRADFWPEKQIWGGGGRLEA